MNKAMDITSIREQVRAEALARGTTVSADMDELERLTGSKDYADALRMLYGTPLTSEEAEIVSALREPGKREWLLAVKDGPHVADCPHQA